jgi:2-polyprenyl-6-methoxyphenol hydroxylase-like FAD-dependent oxidoreductase
LFFFFFFCLVRGEGGIHAIQDALSLSTLLDNAQDGDVGALKAALDGYQKEMIERGSDAVRRSRGAMADATAGKPTMVWGHPMVPLPEVVIKL